jgi:maleylpyruvate isomerase
VSNASAGLARPGQPGEDDEAVPGQLDRDVLEVVLPGAAVRTAVDGTGETMYLSDQARDADIDAGAPRPLPELVADLEHSAAVLAAALPRLGPDHHGIRLERTPGVHLMRAARIPFLRLREVVYHHVDLDAGFTFVHVEPWLVQLFFADEGARLDESERHRALAGDLLWRARGIRTERTS